MCYYKYLFSNTNMRTKAKHSTILKHVTQNIRFKRFLHIQPFRTERLYVRNSDCESAMLYESSKFQVNLLKPTGHVMHQQFNIRQLYVLPTLYLCVLYLSENKQWLVPLTA